MKRNDYEKLVKPLSRFSLKKELSYKQTQNILKHIATDINENDIIAFHDNTFSNNGKEGTLITKDAIYCDYKNVKIPFKDLTDITNIKKKKASINASFVYEDGKTIECFLTTSTQVDEFIDVVRKIAKQYNTNETTEQRNTKTIVKEEIKQESDEEKATRLYWQANELFKNEKYQEAYPIFLESAKLGNIYSQGNVGYMNELALGVEKNLEEAFKWYLISAKENLSSSIINVGRCYFYGIGVEKNLEQARIWDEKGASYNDKGCFVRLGYIYEDSDLTKAVEYYTKAVDLNSDYACDRLGYIYYHGSDNISKDIDKAIDYYKRAGELGNANAYCSLANLYIDIQNLDQASEYASLAKDNGQKDADEILNRIQSLKQESKSKEENIITKQEIKSTEKQQTQTNESLDEYLQQLKAKYKDLHEKVIVDVRVKGICETCQLCVIRMCQEEAISFKDGIPVIDESKCIQCGICEISCPYGFFKMIEVKP